MRWTNAELKGYGKSALRANRWRTILVALILTLLVGNAGRSNANSTANSNSEHYISIGALNIGNSEWNLPDNWTAMNESKSPVISLLPGIFGLGLSFLAGSAVVIFLIAMIVLEIAVFGPLEVGCRRFFLLNLQQQAKVGEIGYAFSHGWINSAIVMLAREVKIILWTILLVIPGIVKAYEYRMVPYLLAENPEMPGHEAFEVSRRMMAGNKMDAFLLDLSFIGWDILSSLTLGLVGLFFSNPYHYSTSAALYDRLRSDQAYRGGDAWR